MTSSFPRFLAGLILVAGGALTGLTAFGIVVARWAIDLKDIAISATDAALLDDMIALTPFVGAFLLLVAAVIVGFALVIDHPRADVAALAVAGSATVAGLAGLVLLILGNDPFAAVPSDQALEGLQIVGTFTAIFAAVVVAVLVARATRRPPQQRPGRRRGRLTVNRSNTDRRPSVHTTTRPAPDPDPRSAPPRRPVASPPSRPSWPVRPSWASAWSRCRPPRSTRPTRNLLVIPTVAFGDRPHGSPSSV